ncbi:MAG: dipeptidase [Ignavibacteria bacterium]|nr:dipeptidase [Ignavibacteria bacterium]
MKHKFILLIAITSFLIFGCSATRTASDLLVLADELHSNMITIDTHTDVPLRFTNSNFDLSVRHNPKEDGSKVDLPRMNEGGLDAIFFAAFVGQGPRTPDGNDKAKQLIEHILDTTISVVNQNSALAEIAYSSDDAYRIKTKGKKAIYLGIENGYAIGNDLSLIKKYYDKGVRYITLCHTKNNDICDSSTDPDTMRYNGLSQFGEEVVKEMNRIGMIVDISHISDSAVYDVLKVSKAPVIASHSCAKALCDNPRNLNDDLLKKIAENGGVVQVCLFTEYLKTPQPNSERDSLLELWRNKYPNYDELTREEKQIARKERVEIEKKFPRVLATVQDVVNHIDHIVKVAGINHVGIGSDFDGGGGVDGCFDVSEMKNITIELLNRGYSQADIKKIWGENFIRVFKTVESIAKKSESPIH